MSFYSSNYLSVVMVTVLLIAASLPSFPVDTGAVRYFCSDDDQQKVVFGNVGLEIFIGRYPSRVKHATPVNDGEGGMMEGSKNRNNNDPKQ